jgi:DNA mismatch repair protein MSH6
MDVVKRADQVSAEFFDAFKAKLASKRRSALPLVALSDFAWLVRTAAGAIKPEGDMQVEGEAAQATQPVGRQMELIRRAVDTYETVNSTVHV